MASDSTYFLRLLAAFKEHYPQKVSDIQAMEARVGAFSDHYDQVNMFFMDAFDRARAEEDCEPVRKKYQEKLDDELRKTKH
jgi:hypothetical protein